MKKIFYRILRKVGILRHLNITTAKSINGQTFSIPVLAETGIENLLRLSEPWMTTLLSHIYAKLAIGPTFIDVGTNIGQTLLKLKSVNPDAYYFGFEPNPICVNYMNRLIQVNRFTNVEVFPVAISNDAGIQELQLFSDSATDGSASLLREFRLASSISRRLNVPVFPFTVIRKCNKAFEQIGIIKIDVEGAELEVLSSMNDILTTQRPIIILEVLPVYSPGNEIRLSRQRAIEQLLQREAYVLFRICKQSDDYLANLCEISEFGIHDDLTMCDYLLCPRELSADMRIITG